MVIAGTGHRPDGLTSKNSAKYSNGLTNALAEFIIPYLYQLKPDRVIAGGAIGFDTGLAVAAIRIGVPLTVAVPFYGQEKKWGKGAQDIYYRILDRAKDVIYVEQGGYAAWKMQSRNEWMVDHADVMLALFNGEIGGTYNCVKYAESVGKEIINLWDDWLMFRTQYKL